MLTNFVGSLIAASLLQVPPPDDIYLEKSPDFSIASAFFKNLAQGVRYNAGIKKLYLTRRERAADSPWQKSANTYAVRYKLTGMSSREGGTEVYLAAS